MGPCYSAKRHRDAEHHWALVPIVRNVFTKIPGAEFTKAPVFNFCIRDISDLQKYLYMILQSVVVINI